MPNVKPGSHHRVHATTIVVACTATVVALLAGCGSSKPKATSTNVASGGNAKAATTKVDLSGKWKGTYGGAFSGTFELNWTQSGNKLTGTITLSAPASTLNLDGTVNGLSINFGTVGSAAITYTGSVTSTGLVMSGSYTVAGKDGGNWGAGKES